MAKRKKPKMNQKNDSVRKPSKRDRRMKLIVYIMVIIMLGSVLTTGLAYLF